MNTKKLINFLLVFFVFIFTGIPALGVDENNKTLKGNVVIIDSENDTVYFIPEDKSEFLEFNYTETQAELEKLSVLDITEDTSLTEREKRLRNIGMFLTIGGMSVSNSVEKSISKGHAHKKIFKNFTHPVKQLKDGWRADDNEFMINYVGHPLEFFMLTNYLKASGASDAESFILSQVTNVAWEYVVEGSYVAPSPKDLAINTIGSIAGIIIYKTVLKKPIDKTYIKIKDLKEKYGIDLAPQLKYNYNTRGVIIGVQMKIAH